MDGLAGLGATVIDVPVRRFVHVGALDGRLVLVVELRGRVPVEEQHELRILADGDLVLVDPEVGEIDAFAPGEKEVAGGDVDLFVEGALVGDEEVDAGPRDERHEGDEAGDVGVKGALLGLARGLHCGDGGAVARADLGGGGGDDFGFECLERLEDGTPRSEAAGAAGLGLDHAAEDGAQAGAEPHSRREHAEEDAPERLHLLLVAGLLAAGLRGHICQPRVAIHAEEEVLRFERGVGDLAAVVVGEALAGDPQELQRGGLVELFTAGGDLGHVAAIHVFVGVEDVAASFARLIHGEDGGVLDVRLGAGIGDEAVLHPRLLRAHGVEDFQADGAIDGGLHRGIDAAPAPLAEQAEDLVSTDILPHEAEAGDGTVLRRVLGLGGRPLDLRGTGRRRLRL